MKRKILLFVFSLMIFLMGSFGVSAKTLDEIKEHNKEALENYTFDFKYANLDDSIERNLKYLSKDNEYIANHPNEYKYRLKFSFLSYLVFRDLGSILDYDNVMGIDMNCFYKGDSKYVDANTSEVVDRDHCDISIYYNTTEDYYSTTIYGNIREVSGDASISREASKVASDLYGTLNVGDIDMINHLVNYKTDTTTFFSSKNATLEFSKIKNVVEKNPKFDIFVGFEETRRGIALTGIANGISYVSYDGVIYDFAFETFYQSQFYFVPVGTKEEDYANVLLDKIKDYVKDDSVNISIEEGGNADSDYVDVSEIITEITGLTGESYYNIIGSDYETEYAKLKKGCHIDGNSSYCNNDEGYNKTKNVMPAKIYTLKINGDSYQIGIIPMSEEYSNKYGVISSLDSKTGIILKTKSGNVPLDASLITELYNLSEEEVNLLKNNGYTNINAYSLKLYSSILDKVINKFNGVTEVLIPYSNDYSNKNLKMLYIKDNNDIEVYDVDTVMYEGNKYLSFKTSHFSNYVLATTDGETVNPNTGDSIVLYMIILALGVIGVILMTIILKKKKKID